MANEKHETLAEIVAEMRSIAKPGETIEHTYELLCGFADRIEAAHKREVEKLNSVIQATVSRSDAEIDRLRREVVEARKQETPGNAAAMREALKVIRGMVNEELEDLKDISDEVRADFISIRGWCGHAIAKPSRNCEVGTAEEQYSRMSRECYEWVCKDCKSSDKDLRKCAMSWEQMPYKEGGAR